MRRHHAIDFPQTIERANRIRDDIARANRVRDDISRANAIEEFEASEPATLHERIGRARKLIRRFSRWPR